MKCEASVWKLHLDFFKIRNREPVHSKPDETDIIVNIATLDISSFIGKIPVETSLAILSNLLTDSPSSQNLAYQVFLSLGLLLVIQHIIIVSFHINI